MKRILGWLWNFIEIVIIVYVVFITSCILCRNKYGFTQFGDYTLASINEVTVNYLDNSKEGNLLVVKDSGVINKGDLIYYYAPIEEEYVIRSGVVTDAVKGETSLYTLNDEDKTSVSSARVLGKYANQYEKYGAILELLESRIGFLFLVLLPIMIVFIYQIYEFVIVLKYDEVDSEDRPKKKKKNKKDKVNKDEISEDKNDTVKTDENKEEKSLEKDEEKDDKSVVSEKEEVKSEKIVEEAKEEKSISTEDKIKAEVNEVIDKVMTEVNSLELDDKKSDDDIELL